MEVTFVPHLVPLDRGILETIYVRLKPGVDADGDRPRADERVRELAVRAADRQRSAGDQARRAHELLRHRLARGSAGRPAGAGRRASTTWSRARPARRFRTSTSPTASTKRWGCCEPTTVLKLGGELLEDAAAMRAAAEAIVRLAAAGPARRRPRRRPRDRRRAARARRGAALRRRPAHHRSRPRSTPSSRCWRDAPTRRSSRRSAPPAAARSGLTGADGRIGLSRRARAAARPSSGEVADLGLVGEPAAPTRRC